MPLPPVEQRRVGRAARVIGGGSATGRGPAKARVIGSVALAAQAVPTLGHSRAGDVGTGADHLVDLAHAVEAVLNGERCAHLAAGGNDASRRRARKVHEQVGGRSVDGRAQRHARRAAAADHHRRDALAVAQVVVAVLVARGARPSGHQRAAGNVGAQGLILIREANRRLRHGADGDALRTRLLARIVGARQQVVGSARRGRSRTDRRVVCRKTPLPCTAWASSPCSAGTDGRSSP